MPQFFLHSDTNSGFILVLAILLAIIWIGEFVRLMSAEEDAFPGQYVRLAWVATFLVFWVLAPFAFIYWRRGQANKRVVRKNTRTEILPKTFTPPETHVE